MNPLTVHLGILASAGIIGACAEIPLHANLSDAELHQRLDANFTPGMTREQVESRLTELKVPMRK